MSLSAEAIIALRSPQHASDARLSDLVELAKLSTSSCFGDKYNLAVALRVLHMLALEDLRGGTGTDTGAAFAGAVTSETEGQLSRSYGSSAGAMGVRFLSLQSTAYGLELIELINGFFFKPRTGRMPGC